MGQRGSIPFLLSHSIRGGSICRVIQPGSPIYNVQTDQVKGAYPKNFEPLISCPYPRGSQRESIRMPSDLDPQTMTSGISGLENFRLRGSVNPADFSVLLGFIYLQRNKSYLIHKIFISILVNQLFVVKILCGT